MPDQKTGRRRMNDMAMDGRNPVARRQDLRNVRKPKGGDDQSITPQELVWLSNEFVFIDGLKQIAQAHLGGMPEHLVRLAAEIGAELAVTIDAKMTPVRKRSGRTKKR